MTVRYIGWSNVMATDGLLGNLNMTVVLICNVKRTGSHLVAGLEIISLIFSIHQNIFRCLYISDENDKSWNLASRRCRESYSASLVSIKNRKELKQLWRLVGRCPFWLGGHNIGGHMVTFINRTFCSGLNRKLDQNKWQWINNDKLSFLHWKINFPRLEDQCSYVGQRKMWKSISCDRKSRKKIKLVCIK